MHFTLDEDQQMIVDTARGFAEAEVAPRAHDLDEAQAFPKDAVRGLAELGLMGMLADPEQGGSGLDVLSAAVAIEEIARHDASLAMILAVHNGQSVLHIDRYGSDELKTQWMPKLVSGQALGTYVDGADVLWATNSGEAWTLTGKLSFAVLAREAGVLVLRADSDEGPKTFVVDRCVAEISVETIEARLGLRAADMGHLTLTDAPATQLEGAGSPEDGAVSGTLIGAICVGIARGALEEARAYSLERKQFNKPIAHFQAIQWKIADTATEVDAARLMVHRSAALLAQGAPAAAAAAQARVMAADAAVKAGYEAIQIFAGNGVIREFPLERMSRDAKVLQSGFGSADEARRRVCAAQLA